MLNNERNPDIYLEDIGIFSYIGGIVRSLTY